MANLKRMQDINLNDLELKNDYYNNFKEGNYEEAWNLIKDNDELSTKVINSENLNNFINEILRFENYPINFKYASIEEPKKLNENINKLKYIGEYNNSKQYDVNNFVLYNNNLYFCIKKPNVGTNPTNTTYWYYLGLRGSDSKPSLGIMYQGEWQSGKSYNKYDAVVYDNKIYIAKNNNSNSNPSTSSTNWYLGMQVEDQTVPVSASEPDNIIEGGIWFEIFN